MEVSPLHLPLRRWLTLGGKEDPTAAAKDGSELLTPTLIRSWKASMFTSQVHAGISTRLPSIYRVWQALRRGLMMTLSWGLSRWHGSTPSLSLICIPLHAHRSSSLSPSPNYLYHTSSKFSPNTASTSFSLSQPTRLPGGWLIKLMMLFYDT